MFLSNTNLNIITHSYILYFGTNSICDCFFHYWLLRCLGWRKKESKTITGEQNLKDIHNNYMLQMQSLINQRAIEAPNPKKQWWKFW